MKKTSIALAAIASFGISSSVIAASGQGTVNFQGSVVETPCGIAPESADQTIDFGQLSKAHLESGGVSIKKDVDIKLVNCTLDTNGTKNNTVAVTFDGSTVGGNLKELGTAGATGTAIVMSAQSGDIEFGKATAPQAFSADNNTLRYSAWVKKATGATLQEGSFTAVSNFTMTYQ